MQKKNCVTQQPQKDTRNTEACSVRSVQTVGTRASQISITNEIVVLKKRDE